jgi:competence protein ComEA
MRTRASTAHQEAVTRRLELLRAGPDPGAYDDEPDQDWWSGHTLMPDGDPPVDPVGAAVPASLPAPLPVPGRHAARRGTPIEAWVPEPLRGRIGLGPWHLVVIAVLISLALALTCGLVLSRRSSAVASPAPAVRSTSPLVTMSAAPVEAASGAVAMPASPAPASPAPASGSSGPAPAMVTVDVEGKVRRPGIVIVPAGSRVTDALAAAGGVPHRRALRGVNLAAVLTDGQQIVVGPGAAPAAGSTSPAGASPAADAPVNLNTATAEQLDTLPDVGPVTAQSIIEWREENGGFTSVQELLEVDGIGPVTLQKLAPHVTV